MRNQFFKVSFDEFCKSKEEINSPIPIQQIYDNIKSPQQATPGSAGHDFFSPIDITLAPGETVKIPTGIRCQLLPGRFLAIYPRSGLGFKYRLQLDNTVGVIDQDYFNADNEGHIFCKMTNDSRSDKTLIIKAGEAFAQGIIQSYEIAHGSEADQGKVRTGGFGSTNGIVEFGQAKGAN